MKWRGRFLFFLTSFWLLPAAWGQGISFSVKDARLEKVFLLIEQQSDHHFIYSDETLSHAKQVTLTVSHEPLDEVLADCFRGQPLEYTVHEKSITVKAKTAGAVARTIQGKVVNENGQAVPGITISIKNTNIAVSTNESGEFTIENVPPSTVLLISGAEIGPQELYIGTKNFVLIHVQSKVGILDETMVIAYGRTSRRYAIGTETSVKANEISKQPIGDPLSILSGRVAGIQVTQLSGVPGSYISVQLRGQNSIANGNDPLYIIDGVPYPSTTLTGIFGGGGGISTSPLNALNPSNIESIEVLKDADATAIYGSRGANGVILIITKKGSEGKPRFDVRYYNGSGVIARKIDLLNTPDYLQMRREAYANDGSSPTNSSAPDLLVWDTTRYTDWQKELIGKTSRVQDATVTYSGGDNETHFLVGTSYRRETTVYPGDYFLQKWSGRANLSHQANRFSFSLSAEYDYNYSKLPQTDFAGQIILPPDAPAVYDSSGKFNWENSTWINPIATGTKLSEFFTDNFISNVTLNLKLLPGLQAKFSGGFTSIVAKDHLTNPQTSLNPNLGQSSYARFGNTEVKTLVAEPQVSYERERHDISVNAVAGLTLQASHQARLFQSGSGYTSDQLLGSLLAASSISTLGETDIRYRYAGIFGRVITDYRKRYFLSMTLRRDGSSRYGEEHRFATFGSLGGSWLFYKETALKNLSWLSFGKLKADFGITGNDQIGDYKYLNLYSPLSYSYLGTTTFSPVQLYNPVYGWERVNKAEIGLEAGLLKERVVVTFNYYHNTTTNQLVSYALPTQTGFDGILRNIPASVLNTGVEVELNTVNVRNGRWSWTSSFNLTIPHNKLLAYDDLESSTYAKRYIIGQSLFIDKTYELTGVDPATGIYTFTDYNRDGRITSPEDQQKIVFTGQQYFGGLENSITYGKFSFSFLFQFVRQKKAPNYTTLFIRPGGRSNQPMFVLDRWQVPGDMTNIERFVYTGIANTAYSNFRKSDGGYGDASFVRLKSLYLSVDLLNDVLRKWRLSTFNIFVQGQNLITITPYKGLDPETQSLLPPIKMLTAGIQFSF